MMKSPTSLIRIRYAVGVMLTLSAVFAVVLTAISVPSDNADAQLADENPDAIAERAEAWWSALTPEQRTNALLGNDYDHDTNANDDDPVGESEGRQLPPEAAGGYPALVANGTAASGTPPTGGVIGKDDVNNLVDGAVANSDIYAVGEHLDTANRITGLRGFQSVELWWGYLDCTEARIAVGEDDDTPSDNFDHDGDNTNDNVLESSAVCEFAETADVGGTTDDATRKAYGDLDADTKALAVKAGQAILGLDAPGSPSSADNARAEAWWNKLDATQMVRALYGSTASTNVDPDIVATTEVDESIDERHERAQAMYDDLADHEKTLVNDRWQWIYNDGGRGNTDDEDKAWVIQWWNSTGCAMMNTAVGQDNGPNAGTNYCAMWDGLQADPTTDAGQTRQARVLEVGQAILGVENPAPNVAAWWNTLSADQMVYVVYGNPPMRTEYTGDHDNDPESADTQGTTVTDADKAVFQKMYDGLTGGIEVDAATTDLDTHLPERITDMLERNGFDVLDASTDNKGTAETADDTFYYSAKGIVDALANEIFDPPTQIMAWVRPDGTLVDSSALGITTRPDPVPGDADFDDEDFDWPYRSDNGPATVADWWETTDCRVMRIAVGEDNNYLNGAIEDNAVTTDVNEAMDAETSIYCGHFPGSLDAMGMRRAPDGPGILTPAAQERVMRVGIALLFGEDNAKATLNDGGRPSFNEEATGTPTISGVAQVGATLMSAPADVADADGLGTFSYQWLRDGEPIPGATNVDYELQPDDVAKAISVRYSFTDDERYYEHRTSNATSTIAGSPGEVSRIEPAIRSVTVSGGDVVQLAVDVYGLQDAKDNSLGANFEWSVNGEDDSDLGSTREIEYIAPSSPGTYNVTAELGGGQCQPEDEGDRDTACSATIVVQVRRPAAPVAEEVPPVDPPGDIPAILTDSDGNQYEVITPVEGGTFDAGEGYSIHVPSGAVPNGEFIGIRMSAEGEASNVGMSHQRYTLGGDSYGIHVVDGSGATVSSTELEDPARVCVPLPDALRTRISDLALVGLNSDGTLTVYAANVRLGDNGTQVCGNVSGIPATVAVGSQGAPAPLPTEVPPEDLLPETGATAPSSNGALFALILGIAVVSLGALATLGRRRNRNVSR